MALQVAGSDPFSHPDRLQDCLRTRAFCQECHHPAKEDLGGKETGGHFNRTQVNAEKMMRIEPTDFAADPAKLFPNDDARDWAEYVSDHGYLRLDPACSYGPSGFCADIGLGIPPSNEDIDDCWEASKPAGVWDYWSLLGLIQIPAQEYTVQLFFEYGTFFNRNHEIVATKTIPPPPSFGDAEEEWEHIYQGLFVKDFGAISLEGQVWTVGDKKWDTTAPDQRPGPW